MIFHPATQISLSLFMILALSVFGIVIYVLKRANARRTHYLFYIAYIALVSIMALTGFTRAHIFQAMPIAIVITIVSAAFFGLSQISRKICDQFTLRQIVGFQSFRLPLELILHNWAFNNVIPTTMTWSGQNWDILSGLLAIVAALTVNRHRRMAVIFQVIGALLLLNVFRVVVFSLPTPFGWPLENPLQLPFEFPYVLILPLCVWPAAVGHFILWQKLRLKKATE